MGPGSPADSGQSHIVSSMPGPRPRSGPGSPAGPLTTPRYGTMSPPSTGSHGLASLMSSLEDSHARMSLPRELVAESKKAPDQAYGFSLEESSAKWDQDSCSWRTSQALLWGGVSELFSGPWTSWGMMRSGILYLPQMSGPLMSARGSGLLPTPSASEAFHGGKQYLRASETWEDCNCLTAKAIGMAYGLKGRQKKPSGKFILDPSFTEWLMGWPTGHTELSNVETEWWLNRASQVDGAESKK